ncbi:MAG: hypothetical protein WHX52_13630 [Anaerolineae bacterium]
MMIFGRTQPLAHYPILDCLPVLQRLGFDGVELCMENDDLSPAVVTPRFAAEVGARATALFSAHSVGYHKDYIYDDGFFELTKRAIALTPDFGADILVFSGTHKRAGDAAEWHTKPLLPAPSLTCGNLSRSSSRSTESCRSPLRFLERNGV